MLNKIVLFLFGCITYPTYGVYCFFKALFAPTNTISEQ